MTRDELIARIEAGETGPELLCAIADIAGWTPKDGSLSEILAFYRGSKDSAFAMAGVPSWLTSIDAAVSLVGVGTYWFADGFGKAMVWGLDVNRGESRITNNPAAALTAAWLKATA